MSQASDSSPARAPDPFPWLRELVREWFAGDATQQACAQALQGRLDAMTGDDVRAMVQARQSENLAMAQARGRGEEEGELADTQAALERLRGGVEDLMATLMGVVAWGRGRPGEGRTWSAQGHEQAVRLALDAIERQESLLGGRPELGASPGLAGEALLPRYGLAWNGPRNFVATPMADGYWTPWHLADQALRQALRGGADATDTVLVPWALPFALLGEAAGGAVADDPQRTWDFLLAGVGKPALEPEDDPRQWRRVPRRLDAQLAQMASLALETGNPNHLWTVVLSRAGKLPEPVGAPGEASAEAAAPVAWVRVASDGQREWLWADQIEPVRQRSGTWKPVFWAAWTPAGEASLTEAMLQAGLEACPLFSVPGKGRRVSLDTGELARIYLAMDQARVQPAGQAASG